MIVIDTSVVLAFMDRRDSDHELVREWMESAEDELTTTPLVVAETLKIATLDERHFRAVRPLTDNSRVFTLLPADAD